MQQRILALAVRTHRVRTMRNASSIFAGATVFADWLTAKVPVVKLLKELARAGNAEETATDVFRVKPAVISIRIVQLGTSAILQL